MRRTSFRPASCAAPPPLRNSSLRRTRYGRALCMQRARARTNTWIALCVSVWLCVRVRSRVCVCVCDAMSGQRQTLLVRPHAVRIQQTTPAPALSAPRVAPHRTAPLTPSDGWRGRWRAFVIMRARVESSLGVPRLPQFAAGRRVPPSASRRAPRRLAAALS